jgi:hypothetical protein
MTMKDPAGYFLPCTSNSRVARCTLMPTSRKALMNFTAVGKSA